MLLNQLSTEARIFFSAAFDLSQDLRTAVCREAGLMATYPLHYAAVKGNIPVIEELIDNGVDIDQLDYSYANREIFGCLTPLMRASDGINLEKKKCIIEALLLKNADIHFKNERNETVLTYAIFIQDVNLFEFLLKKGSDPFRDMEVAARLKFRLGNLMENKPYQFMRVLRLLADSQQDGLVYLKFEQDFLKMLEKCRSYIKAHHQVTIDPQLHQPLAANPVPIQTADVPVAAQEPLDLSVPSIPRFFRSTEKLLRDIQTGEDMVNAFRMDLDKQSFRAYLEMTSKWVLEEKKLMPSSHDKEMLKRYNMVTKKLPIDLEQMLAVSHFGYSYPEINRQESVPIGNSKKRRHDAAENSSDNITRSCTF